MSSDVATVTAVPMIDEALALQVARMTVPRHTTRAGEVAALRAAVAEDLPRVDAAARAWTRLGADLPPTDVRVVGRIGWVQANLAALRGALDPLSGKIKTSPVVASRVLGVQLGGLLGLLSSKVLGQYVLPLGGPGGGQLVVVGPNFLDLASEHGEVATGIRRAVLLHEVTHRLQFDAVGWLGGHLTSLLDRYLRDARIDPGTLVEAAGRLPAALAKVRETGSIVPIVETVLTPVQAQVISEAQGLMSLLEGHGNATMFNAADGLLEDPQAVRAALQRRRTDVTTRVLTAVAGLDMKRRQYREGEAFVDAVVGAAGVDGLNRAFEQPANLPSQDEVADPSAWLARVQAA